MRFPLIFLGFHRFWGDVVVDRAVSMADMDVWEVGRDREASPTFVQVLWVPQISPDTRRTPQMHPPVCYRPQFWIAEKPHLLFMNLSIK